MGLTILEDCTTSPLVILSTAITSSRPGMAYRLAAKSGGIYNVTFENIRMKSTDRGPRIKSCRGRGGTVQNIVYCNITGDDMVLSISIDLDSLEVRKTDEQKMDRPKHPFGEFMFSHGSNYGEFRGLQGKPFANITLKNVITKDSTGAFGNCEILKVVYALR